MLGILLGAIIRPGMAHADEKQQCVAASEKAQQLRNAGRLTEAREQLVQCGRNECPKLVQQDCSEWMREVLAILPTVVPGAKDKDGRDIVDVNVSIDGKLVTETLDGKAIPVDPGVHTFRFERKGRPTTDTKAPSVEEQVVIRQGEKNRILTVTLADHERPTGSKPPDETNTPGKAASPPIAAYVTGGVGVVALGVGLYLMLDANADARELRSTCAPRCEQSAVDDVDNRQVIAGVTAGLGGAALVAAAVLFFTHDRGRPSSTSRLLPGIAPISRGGVVSAGIRF